MKAKDFVEEFGLDLLGNDKGFRGEELELVYNSLIELDEFKNKNLSIIKEINVKKHDFTLKENGIQVTSEIEPDLISIIDSPDLKFNENIEIYSMFMADDKLLYRVTKESIIIEPRDLKLIQAEERIKKAESEIEVDKLAYYKFYNLPLPESTDNQ